MASHKSPDFACGQVIFGLRMSGLNYAVNETPFSVYITIRKKFVRGAFEKQIMLGDITNTSEKDLKIDSLGKLNKEIERKLAFAKFDYEASEVKLEKLVKDKLKCEEQLENLLMKERLLEENMKTNAKRFEELKTIGDKASKENKALSLKVKNQDIKLQDKGDSLDILEHTVQNKHLEIVRLRQEVDDLRINHELVEHNYNSEEVKSDSIPDEESDSEKASTSTRKHLKCDQCNDEFANNEHLEAHVGMHHKLDCDYCDFSTNTDNELEEHVDDCHLNECKECDFRTKSKVEFSKHLSNEHELKCSKCEGIFKTRSKESTHICQVK